MVRTVQICFGLNCTIEMKSDAEILPKHPAQTSTPPLSAPLPPLLSFRQDGCSSPRLHLLHGCSFPKLLPLFEGSTHQFAMRKRVQISNSIDGFTPPLSLSLSLSLSSHLSPSWESQSPTTNTTQSQVSSLSFSDFSISGGSAPPTTHRRPPLPSTTDRCHRKKPSSPSLFPTTNDLSPLFHQML